MKRLRLRRVDLQVTFFTAAIVLVSSMLISFFYYRFAYDDMIGTLNERVESIYGYLDQTLDKSTFTEINTREDQQKPSYQPVSYTHLDVYKRQDQHRGPGDRQLECHSGRRDQGETSRVRGRRQPPGAGGPAGGGPERSRGELLPGRGSPGSGGLTSYA